MTDRVNTITVALDHEMRVDDVQAIVDAIKAMRHVLDAKPGDVEPAWAIREQMRMEFRKRLLIALDPTP